MTENRYWNLLAKKLAGEASPEELQELEQLARQHPEWLYSAEIVENLWTLPAKETTAYDSELAFELHLNNLKKNGVDLEELNTPVTIAVEKNFERPARKKKRLLAYSFSFALLALAVAFSWRYTHGKSVPVPAKAFSEVSTRLGSKTKLVLPDSTVVWLNAGSRLTYSKDFGISSRNTTLTGEAFFDVRKSSIPFIIRTKAIQIKVLGTAFNVKSYPEEKTTETSLIRGRVEITMDKRPGEKFILMPNEKLTVADDPVEEAKAEQKKEPIISLNRLTHTNDSTVVETSWVENKLVFQNESFAELANKLERWYGVTIAFKDEKIASQRLSGTFTTETIQEAMEELKLTTNFQYSLKATMITITK